MYSHPPVSLKTIQGSVVEPRLRKLKTPRDCPACGGDRSPGYIRRIRYARQVSAGGTLKPVLAPWLEQSPVPEELRRYWRVPFHRSQALPRLRPACEAKARGLAQVAHRAEERVCSPLWLSWA